MPRARIFVSSTFFDLRQVRADLERFIREMGYEPVLNEQGSIPYGSEEKIEEYAYKEVDQCDLLVAIIGGRFGSESHHQPYSISQVELQRAVSAGKQIFVFVEKSVHAEYATYLLNQEVEGIRYRFVDDVRIFEFIEEVESLPRNNPIATFETAQDITRYLREQWAGLFQRFLQQQSLLKETQLLEDMQGTVRTLNQLVTFLTEERRNRDEAVREILLANHPIFERFQTLLRIPHRVFFTSIDELDQWLKPRRFASVKSSAWDDEKHREWYKSLPHAEFDLLKIQIDVFDDNGKLRIFTPDEWDDDWITLERRADEDDEGDEEAPE